MTGEYIGLAVVGGCWFASGSVEQQRDGDGDEVADPESGVPDADGGGELEGEEAHPEGGGAECGVEEGEPVEQEGGEAGTRRDRAQRRSGVVQEHGRQEEQVVAGIEALRRTC